MEKIRSDISERFDNVTVKHRQLGEEMSALLSQHEGLVSLSMKLNKKFIEINNHYFNRLQESKSQYTRTVEVEMQMKSLYELSQKMAFAEIERFIPENKSRVLQVLTFERQIAMAFSRLMLLPRREEQLKVLDWLEHEQASSRQHFMDAKAEFIQRYDVLKKIEDYLAGIGEQAPCTEYARADIPQC